MNQPRYNDLFGQCTQDQYVARYDPSFYRDQAGALYRWREQRGLHECDLDRREWMYEADAEDLRMYVWARKQAILAARCH